MSEDSADPVQTALKVVFVTGACFWGCKRTLPQVAMSGMRFKRKGLKRRRDGPRSDFQNTFSITEHRHSAALGGQWFFVVFFFTKQVVQIYSAVNPAGRFVFKTSAVLLLIK